MTISVTISASILAHASFAIFDDIGRDEARRRAFEELVRPEYQQESLLERLVRLVREFFDGLLDQAPGGVPGGLTALALIILLIAALIGLIAWQARKATSGRRVAEGLFGTRERTADEHRREAERLAGESRWAEAIRERLRAIARDLEHRAIVAPQPGRTADELAEAAGAELPAFAGRLTGAARLFDDVTYGQRHGSPEGYATMTTLDEDLRAARPAALAGQAHAGAPPRTAAP
ncbi:hypothetical protein Ssi03_07490 [Sphaerisporangium siamense]|uniref:Type II secretory pathway pseudopilin PulG n=1 Tax=Sphaerisporangium siamense TaxID=795645 RepID=A0A7W7GCA6_9ACTN|nr:DUF4129 domain-containing protein [Sphaerisporangium siamense]MBB4705848.1 type II secretory pathway pseudopilin PulG [Sphaerisporangium siamense]GII82759.1 hypothetical protein Ssi03_07490 [Sphaerisporangium siamense]